MLDDPKHLESQAPKNLNLAGQKPCVAASGRYSDSWKNWLARVGCADPDDKEIGSLDFSRGLPIRPNADSWQLLLSIVFKEFDVKLEDLLTQCESDTRSIIGTRAARALSRWRECTSQGEQIKFIQRLIDKPEGQANGYLLSKSGGLSLEQIVLDHMPQLFDEDDLRQAAMTLGRSWPAKAS